MKIFFSAKGEAEVEDGDNCKNNNKINDVDGKE